MIVYANVQSHNGQYEHALVPHKSRWGIKPTEEKESVASLCRAQTSAALMASTAAAHGCQSTTKAGHKGKMRLQHSAQNTLQENLPKDTLGPEPCHSPCLFILGQSAKPCMQGLCAARIGPRGALLMLPALRQQTPALLAHRHQNTKWACLAARAMLELRKLLLSMQLLSYVHPEGAMHTCNVHTHCSP